MVNFPSRVDTAGRGTGNQDRTPRRIGGLLVVYLVILGILVVHGLGLTVAAVVVNANPSLGNLSEPVPWGYITFYVVTNVILAVYSIVVMRLIVTKRKSAVAHNAIWAFLTAAFLVVWHFMGMKSLAGVFIDSAPGLAGILYLALSRRVKQTLTRS
jgi:hypothetical protein